MNLYHYCTLLSLLLFANFYFVECNINVTECAHDLLGLDSVEDEDFCHGERTKRAVFLPYKSGKETAEHMSKTLDFLLRPSRYNKRIRPGLGKKKLKVELNMSIRAMGPVDENTQSFFIDCYFRQTWIDDRLKFNSTAGMSELSLDWKILTMMWKPDTFFLNGKKSKLHKITVPNRFSRIAPNGKVSYSQRLTIAATCPMSLKKFPFDSQICPLKIGSYGYQASDMEYVWKEKPLSMGKFDMAQFKLMHWTSGLSTNRTNRMLESGFRTDSVAYLHFYFERQSGYFILQIYTPLLLIVMCSWVAFWIIKTDVPARSALGVTTVLSVTKIGFGGKGKPQVPYATAQDTFVIICFVSVFASLIEFAVINFITVFVSRYKACEEKERERKEKEKEAEEKALQLQKEILNAVRKESGRKERRRKRMEDESMKRVASLVPPRASEEDSSADYVEKEEEEVASDLQAMEEEIEDDDDSEYEDIDEEEKEEEEEEEDEEKELNSEGSSAIARFRAYEKKIKKEEADKKKKKREMFKTTKKRLMKFQSSILHLTARTLSFFTLKPIHQLSLYRETEDVLERIDSLSRTYFPTMFAVTMFIYYATYFYIMPDEVLVEVYE